MHPVAGNGGVGKVARVLKLGVVRSQDNVAEQGELRVAQAGPLMAAIMGASMSRRFVRSCLPSRKVAYQSRGLRARPPLRAARGPVKASPAPVMMTTLLSGSFPTSAKARGALREGRLPTEGYPRRCGRSSVISRPRRSHTDVLVLVGVLFESGHDHTSRRSV